VVFASRHFLGSPLGPSAASLLPPPPTPTPTPQKTLNQVDNLDIFAIGPLFEKNAVFPAKTNTEFVEVRSWGGGLREGGEGGGLREGVEGGGLRGDG